MGHAAQQTPLSTPDCGKRRQQLKEELGNSIDLHSETDADGESEDSAGPGARHEARRPTRQHLVAHSWPKRRLDDWLNHAVPRRLPSHKALQMIPFAGTRRQTSSCPIRPVTPEVAGSSPVAPVALNACK